MDPTLNVDDLPSLAVDAEPVNTYPSSEMPPAPTHVASGSAFDQANREKESEQALVPAQASEPSAAPVVETIPEAPPQRTTEAATPSEAVVTLDAAEASFATLDDLAGDTDENLLASLFGVNFEIDDDVLARDVIDPNLVDTRDVFTSFFGAATEGDIVMNENNRELLEELMNINRKVSARDEAYEVFGDGIDALAFERATPFSVLHMAPPAAVPTDVQTRSWLVNMPTMFPNRQVLHADPQPYFPSACPHLESNARMLFTPHNVIRWSYHAGQNMFLSNTRMVRWSDGSVTLHVGSDMHQIQDAKSNEALELLCTPTMVRKGEMEVPALVASVFPRRRCVIESNEATSIKQAVMHENVVSKEMSSRLALPYTSVPLPKVDWNRPSRNNGPLEEYVATEYARRMKEITARAKEGKRMSLAEQVDMESKLLQELRNTSLEELQEMQQEARRQETLRVAQRQQNQSRGKRSRFQRDLGLTADGAVEVAYNTVEGEDEYLDADDGDNDSGLDAGDEDDYEAQYRRLYGGASAEDDDGNQQRRKAARLEQEQHAKAAPLIDAMQALVEEIPMSALKYGDVQGTLDYLRTGSFSVDMMKREIPLILSELKDELPHIDVSQVDQAFKRAF